MDLILTALIDKADKILGLLFKYELHAFILLLTGIVMYLHGLTEQGSGVIGAALLIFKGKNS
jgi:hypothetical protein